LGLKEETVLDRSARDLGPSTFVWSAQFLGQLGPKGWAMSSAQALVRQLKKIVKIKEIFCLFITHTLIKMQIKAVENNVVST